jgi:hypothetical protein
MGLTAVVYRSFPVVAKSRLATWHFLLYQLALPAMLVAVAAVHAGNKGAEPIAAVASVVVLVSVMVFCWLVFSARGDESRSWGDVRGPFRICVESGANSTFGNVLSTVDSRDRHRSRYASCTAPTSAGRGSAPTISPKSSVRSTAAPGANRRTSG